MTDGLQEVAASGSLVLAVPLAVVAGLVSFFSPCVIPLVPAYFSYTTGLSGADLAEGNASRRRLVAGALLFIAGFSVVFVLLGLAAGGLATWLVSYQRELTVVLGLVAILMGLAFLGVVPWLQRDVRVHSVPAVGLGAAPVLGFLFGLGWTPCMGPTLGVISTLAANEGTAARGGVLLAFYAIGLGIPFLLFALLWRRMLRTLAFVRRHQRWVTGFGGVFMILIGLALLTGWWDYAVQWLQINLVNGTTVMV
ncbi:cytochrome c biogenesis CcdA family protein [Nocardioides insulae]|uniref:cytochrome c biogenesis CcdA family protein n=1 Tax=Nocardioides insulae TaxID=394734 RepID=UPI00040BB211|nr:cytochrome c biogenesis protein CcdA [Nocardioides insulae]